jgi:hypothetical protein
MTSFDKDTFLATHVEGAMESKFTPYPVGDYRAFIDDVTPGQIGDAMVLYVTYVLIDEKAKAFMGRDRPTLRDTIFLDFEEDGRLAMGINKNIALGALREAVGQNGSGPWAPGMLRGAGPVLLKVNQVMNKKGQGPFSNVERVTKG